MEYFLFGPMRVRADSGDLSLGGPKQRAVLAILVLADGSVVRFERLVDGLWGQHPPEKALASLRSYMANLRRVFQAGAGPSAPRRLTTRSVGYHLDLGDDPVDIHRFEELAAAGRRALTGGDAVTAHDLLTRAGQVWSGDPLAEFSGWSFADPEIERLTGLRRSVIEARFDAALLLGRHADLVPEIEAAITATPVQERLWAQLMLALARSGRRAEALQAYDRVRRVLDQELSVTPGDELRRLFHDLCHDNADPPPGVAVLSAATPAAPTAPAAPAWTGQPLAGRSAELAWLGRMADSARRGHGGFAVLTGESGIGKTTLAAAVTGYARHAGMTAAWAGHPDGLRKPLLWGWIQLLRELGAQLGAATRAAVCAAAPETAALVPEWPEWGAGPVVHRTADPAFEAIDGIVRAVREFAAASPLLLVLDDVHRADRPTRDVLALLADRLHHLPALVVLTWSAVVSAENCDEYDRLVGRSDVSALELAGLDDDGIGSLVEQLSGVPPSPAFVAMMRQHSGGNPFFVREIVRFLSTRGHFDGHTLTPDGDPVPDAVTGVVRRRMSELAPDTRAVLGAAAVIGAEFEPIAVAEVLGLPAVTVRERLGDARRAAMIDETAGRPGWFTFSHGVTRRAVVAQLDSDERAELHALVAHVRMRDATGRSYEWLLATADHAWQAGAALEAATALAITDLALAAATTRSAYADIAVLAEHSLQICARLPREPDRFERESALWLRLALVWTALKGQNHEDVGRAFRHAFDTGDRHGTAQISAVVLHCVMICAQGRYREAADIADGLIARYEDTVDPQAGAGYYIRALIDCLRGDLEASIANVEFALANVPIPGDPVPIARYDVRLHAVAAVVLGLRGEQERAWQAARTGIDLGVTTGDAYSTAMVRLAALQANAIQGIVPGTARSADVVARELAELGMAQLAASARIMRDWALAVGPDRADTAAAAHAAYEIVTDGGSTTMLAPLYLALLADIESACGNVDAARELVHRGELLAAATGEHAWNRLLSQRLHRLRADSALPRRVGDLGA
ncbi:BTAD domain-containing putative transcriptional regulator [Nocardia sp. BMG111209]|uniref:BTAD domain-containing putative transcriptional regulator n=1 Tax=Nocardia sp. BMG111209 TaxID=1160137 RepID=UPI000371C517|nr:BTAD domain-containing putative transcriptional regulator [Nocardia sp. BMG111209]